MLDHFNTLGLGPSFLGWEGQGLGVAHEVAAAPVGDEEVGEGEVPVHVAAPFHFVDGEDVVS